MNSGCRRAAGSFAGFPRRLGGAGRIPTPLVTAFTGTTLRGLLLEAYAFSTIGTIMLWGAIAAFIAALCMSALVGLGFWHARRTTEEAQVLAPKAAPAS